MEQKKVIVDALEFGVFGSGKNLSDWERIKKTKEVFKDLRKGGLIDENGFTEKGREVLKSLFSL